MDLNLKVDSEIQKHYLEGKKLDRKNLEVILKEISLKKDEDDIRDFMKLLILYFFCYIFFTNTNNLCTKGPVPLVNELPTLECYN